MRKYNPPWLFHRFFRWYCDPKLLKYIEGDLLEVYKEQVDEKGKRKANWKFIKDVILLCRPGIIKPVKRYHTPNQLDMFKSYFKIGWRNLIKNRAFSAINIAGLSLGITCSVLIALWVQDEYNMDAFHEDIDQIYTVTSTEYSGYEITYGGYDTPGLLGEEMKRVLPEVEYACNTSWIGWYTFSVDDKKMTIPGGHAGVDFFQIFSYPFIIGNKASALQSPESIVISRKMANNFFGSPEQAMGKALTFDNYKELKVTGVFEDLGDNVSRKFEFLINWEFFVERQTWLKNWHNSGPTTFVKLKHQTDAAALERKIQHFIKDYDKDYSEIDRLELSLQPYRDKYLYSNFKDGKVAGGKIEYVQLFRFVAIFILIIACINFMNLSTARAVKRAKEIGVKKVIGAQRMSLISQFMIEAFLFTLIAISISLVAINLLLPEFNLLSGKNMIFPFTEAYFWIGILILTIITSVISGSYPSFLLSSFKPIAVLKSNVKVNSGSVFFRKSLVVFQFTLSIIFIVGMLVVSKQVDYIQNKNLGYEKSNLLYLSIKGNMANNFDVFKNEASNIPEIVNISHMSARPLELESTTGSVQWEGKNPETLPVFTQMAIGYNYINTMESTMLYGRDFSEDFADSANYIINEKALEIIGYEDPIGMPLEFWGIKGTIVGVVNDFHFQTLHVPIKPLVIRLNHGRKWGYALIRTAPGKTKMAIERLEALHEKLNPDFPFAVQFADEEYNYLYKSEQVAKEISFYFAFLAIFISCLGLFGLMIFTAQQRTKEVGIRKVLGANVAQIVSLLSKDLLKLVMISTVLSIPIAYYLMTEWLNAYEYHVDMQWMVFLLAAVGAFIIAIFTLSFQAIKTALANPVDSLKSE